MINRKDAEAKVQIWLDRHSPQKPRPNPGAQNCESPVTVQAAQETETVATAAEAENQEQEPIELGVPADQLHKRLNLIKPNDR